MKRTRDWHLQLLTDADLRQYSARDEVLDWLNDNASVRERQLTCQQWLLSSAAKRMVFHRLYRDLLQRSDLKILDVGGGLTSFTRALGQRHDYALVDLLAHDKEARREFEGTSPGLRLIVDDWLNVCEKVGPFDLVLANDVFPNVDQRLELFLQRILPLSRQLRISLTYFHDPRFYFTRRVEGEEILCMLQWDSMQLASVLNRTAAPDVIDGLYVISERRPSLFPNGRQVSVLTVNSGV